MCVKEDGAEADYECMDRVTGLCAPSDSGVCPIGYDRCSRNSADALLRPPRPESVLLHADIKLQVTQKGVKLLLKARVFVLDNIPKYRLYQNFQAHALACSAVSNIAD